MDSPVRSDSVCLYIPVKHSRDKVTVPLEALPKDPDVLLDIFKAEEVPLALWLTLGKEYLKQNNERNFEHILREGTSQEALDYFAGDPTACVAMLEARGAFHLAKARAARPGDAVSHRAALEEASRAYNTAISLQRSAGAYCGLGYVDLAQGEAVRAVRHFSTAASLDRRNALPLLGLAAAYFHEGRYKTSLGKYREVLRLFGGSKSPPGVRLGIALCHERLGEPELAAEAARRELIAEPRSAPALAALAGLALQGARRLAAEARLAEAEHREAVASGAKSARRKALRERAAELRADALKGREEGAGLLSRALDANPACAAALVHAAELTLRKNDNTACLELSRAAVELAEASTGGAATALSASLSAAAQFALGRAMHADGHTDDARTSYSAAMAAMAHLPAARRPPAPALELRLAQATADSLDALGSEIGPNTKNAASRAARFAEDAAKHAPSAANAHRLLAALRERTGDVTGAKDALRGALAATPRDGAAWLHKATLLDRSPADASEALEAYEKARELLGDSLRESVEPWRMHSNAGVLCQYLGKLDEADTAFDRALAEFAPGEDGQPLTAERAAAERPAAAVVSFNVGLLREAQGRLHEAGGIYRALLVAHPTMAECHLRMASMAVDAGQLNAALELAEQAVSAAEAGATDGKLGGAGADALCMRAYVMTLTEDWEGAAKAFEKVRNASERDGYATVGLANCNLRFGLRYLASLERSRGRVAREDERRTTVKAEQFLLRALDLYTKALSASPGSAYAANGVGVILAERGRLNHARKVFTQVHEAVAVDSVAQLRDVWVNLAHCLLVQGQFMAAEQLYVRALSQELKPGADGTARADTAGAQADGSSHGGGGSAAQQLDCTILVCLARAYYDADRLPDAKAALRRVLALDGEDAVAAFNAAYVSQEIAVRTLKRGDKTADECRSAVAELREAAGGFGALLQRVKSNKIPKAARDNLEARKLEEHRRFCEEFITRAGAHLRAAEEAEAAAMASKAREAAAVEAELAKQEAARVKKEAEERERQEALERRARENNARFAEMKAKWAEKGGDGEGRGKKRKKGAKDESPEDEQPAVDADVLADAGLLDSDDDDGMGNEFNAAAKEAEANAAIAAAGLEESDDEKEDAMEGVSVEAAAEAEDITKAELAAAGLEDTDDDDEALVPAAAGGTDGGAEPAKRRRVGILDDDDE